MSNTHNSTERDLAFVQWIEDRFHHEPLNEAGEASTDTPLARAGKAGDFEPLMREPEVIARLNSEPVSTPVRDLFQKAFWNVAG